MNTELRARRDLGDILGQAFRTYGAHFTTFLALGLLTAPITMLAVVIRPGGGLSFDDPLLTLLDLLNLLVALVAGAAIVFALNEVAGGTDAAPGRAIDAALSRFGALFTTGLLAGVIGLASLLSFPFLALYWLVRRDATIDGRRNWWLTLPLVLPIYLVVRWAFVTQAVMLESKRNWSALDESAGTVRGSWWRTFGILIAISLIAIAISAVTGIGVLGPPLVEAVLSAGGAALTLGLVTIAQTLLYWDLRARKVMEADVTAA